MTTATTLSISTVPTASRLLIVRNGDGVRIEEQGTGKAWIPNNWCTRDELERLQEAITLYLAQDARSVGNGAGG